MYFEISDPHTLSTLIGGSCVGLPVSKLTRKENYIHHILALSGTLDINQRVLSGRVRTDYQGDPPPH